MDVKEERCLSERALKLRSRWVTRVPITCQIANALESVSETRHCISTVLASTASGTSASFLAKSRVQVCFRVTVSEPAPPAV